ncbi:MAG: response regulator transcription factor [Candidatus Caenarcaniphilales bacterium]|nr:response regulator transcription factor [Candidatus Caenarcaniphilales bacterium]
MNPITKDKKILIIEDEEPLRKLLQMELVTHNGVQTEVPTDFNDLLGQIQRFNPDLIIYNLNVGSENGVSLCEKLRFQGNDAWIITIGSKHNINEKIQALESGSDDHYAKPFSSEELIAKIRAMLRRSSPTNREGVLEYSNLRMDLINRTVWRGNRQIDLRSKEFDLLKVFLLKPEEVLNREFIFDQVWGSNFLGDSNVIEVYVRYLRAKLQKPSLIKTRRGNGYILISDESQINKASTNFEL